MGAGLRGGAGVFGAGDGVSAVGSDAGGAARADAAIVNSGSAATYAGAVFGFDDKCTGYCGIKRQISTSKKTADLGGYCQICFGWRSACCVCRSMYPYTSSHTSRDSTGGWIALIGYSCWKSRNAVNFYAHDGI